MAQAYAADAAHAARDCLQITLDYSIESLRSFDQLLERYRPIWAECAEAVAEGKVDGPMIDGFPFPSAMWGYYVGEVLRRKCGGEWVQSDKPNPYGSLELLVKGRRVSPVDAVTQWFETSGAVSVWTFCEKIIEA